MVAPTPVHREPLLLLGAGRVGNSITWIRSVIILAPLRDVAVHVVQAQRIPVVIGNAAGGFQVHAGFGLAVGMEAVKVGLAGSERAAVADAKGLGRRTPSSTGILPFRFRRQA